MVIELGELDLLTAEGRAAARKKLAEVGQQFLVNEFEELRNAESRDEPVSERVNSLINLLGNMDDLDKALQRPIPKVEKWDDIEIAEREWLIPSWLPANTATLFTGTGGAGKSWLTLQMVCQLAAGYRDAFLYPDFETDQKGISKHIVFATYEDEPAEIKRRIQALASEFKWIHTSMDTIKEHMHIVDMRGIGSVWGPGQGKHVSVMGDLLQAGIDLLDICEERQADLLVMDPLSGAFGGNENDRTAVYDFVSCFRKWGDTAAVNCALLLVGHLPKGKESAYSGSTAWEASVRAMWLLGKKEKHVHGEKGKVKETLYYYALEHTKSNYAAIQPMKYLAKNNFGWWTEVESEQEACDAYEAYHSDKEAVYEDTCGIPL